ncbi:hypothetical protein B0H14DRAFT_3438498 [Mycena olivaceomarginata]|nr:hypothetical protein B0H14DRAFT_3438498 [Mycena olivaceomarginata]
MTIQTRSRAASQDPDQAPRASEPEADGSLNSDVEPGSDYMGGRGDEENDEEEDKEGDEDDEEDETASHVSKADSVGARSTNATNARSPLWQAWQDRLLIAQTDRDRPFSAPRRERSKAWDAMANNLAIAAAQQGSELVRSGEACKARVSYLRKKYKSDQARLLQKTGTDEEIDAHMELLGQLCELIDVQGGAKDGAAKKKLNLETEAGLAARDAMMKGLVKSAELVDLALLPDASIRERQGQHGTKRKAASADDKENRSSSRNAANKRRKKQETALQDILNRRLHDDKAALETYANQERERHTEQVGLLGELVTSIRGLNNQITRMRGEQEKTNVYLRQQELDRREAEIRARERELGLEQ